ncbi:hypothetical protein [Bacillus sp. Marseille-Q1617]|nr:hypothetical protein [Bacillus sp. Marseille-Q1617]
MTEEENIKFMMELSDMIHDKYFREYKEQVRTLTKRVDELKV